MPRVYRTRPSVIRGTRPSQVTTMTPTQARQFWKALMDNASALITDANLLLAAGSFGRARSLSVLAQEELGKALWIYDEFHTAWSTGDEKSRGERRLANHGRNQVLLGFPWTDLRLVGGPVIVVVPGAP
jgi:hypothetical protein